MQPLAPTIAPDGRILYPRVRRLTLPIPTDPTSWAPIAPTIVRPWSSNAKVGACAITARPQLTCPAGCPLRGAGCYAENRGQRGRPSPFDVATRHALRPDADAGADLARLAQRRYRRVPAGIRFNVSGDLYTTITGPDAQPLTVPDYGYMAAMERIATAHPWTAWTYTHAWADPRIDAGRSLAPHVTIRASVENADDATAAMLAGWPVAIVDPGPDAPDTLIRRTIAGPGGRAVPVIQCPATNPSARTQNCADCLACAKPITRRTGSVIAFPTHGAKRRAAAAAVRATR